MFITMMYLNPLKYQGLNLKSKRILDAYLVLHSTTSLHIRHTLYK